MNTITLKSIEHCERALYKLKSKGYMHFWSQYSWELPEGFLMCFTNGEKQVVLKTTEKDIQKKLISEGHWRI